MLSRLASDGLSGSYYRAEEFSCTQCCEVVVALYSASGFSYPGTDLG